MFFNRLIFSLWVKNIKINIIPKNIALFFGSKNNTYIGIERDPIKEAKEENLEIKKVISQQAPKTSPKVKFILKSIPTYVATPLPPLNLNQIGNTCPL